MATVDRDQQVALGLIRQQRPANWVPAEPEPVRTVTGEIVPMPDGGMMPMMGGPMVPAQQVLLRTTYVDRARGFSIRTAQLSTVVGVVVLMAGAVLTSVALSLVLGTAVVTFGVVWVVAFWLDTAHSPDGVARYNSKRMWDEVAKMNAARVDAFRSANGIKRKGRR